MIELLRSLNRPKHKTFHTPGMAMRCEEDRRNLTARQEVVLGFDQNVMKRLSILQIGAGGLGGEICQGLVRKGVGTVKVFDGDVVEPSNLTRQRFYPKDLYRNKALSLAGNLMKEAIIKTEIIAYPFMFQRALEEGMNMDCDIVICAPDNDEVRRFTAKYFLNKVPVIFTGLDRKANTGYVFIQEPGKACFECAIPSAKRNKREPCPNTPAVIDLVKIISGLVLFAVDSTVMHRKRNWNYRQIFLCGYIPEIIWTVKRSNKCQICGTKW
ncbi:ThiF family adenylyltransferase [candidate division TA06 bacterium]|nr:ThiF family adenylyltransferase [candidate division TA06 bacterium]